MNSTPDHAPASSRQRQELRALATAFSFLTRIPVPPFAWSEHSFRQSTAYFPLVGLVIGALSAAVFTISAMLWPQSIAAVLTLVTAVALTGAFHEDGLADSADGLGGGWTTEDKLRIMKDSRIGTYGAVTLFLALALKLACLASTVAAMVPLALITAHTLGRWTTLPLVRFCAYVSEGASGKPLVGSVSARRIGLGTAIAVLPLLWLPLPQALALIAVVAALLVSSQRWLRRSIGGITGDTLGAVNQLTECAVLLFFCAHYAI
ncbi:adenosylcobinamide-GDP ribazoletransferase [Halioglobus japonicus]|uniref:Adenosylcobinamide-GDP ribazoletransferase n=1 Tax=Halioglobus japonicus TaxID=930805 RepID=A0AAP8SPK9_9GAMM|nr:adenosylcobinamide-GDP ribazoletransferase [Halioglobus japonicus]AQA19184.1 adenosylcobinamide-GDP ribazoletransferase [Halioglobus japonicus]PLW87780.1 adenosylcobinamide-GDP ribazoletransferase [Halioglobus japonicus]